MCTAQPSFLFNSFLKFMFNFRNTIPGIILSPLNPNLHTLIMPSLQMRKLRQGEVIKLAQGHTVCELCAGSMVTVLHLGKNFTETGPSTLGALKCWLCALASSEMRCPPPNPRHFPCHVPCVRRLLSRCDPDFLSLFFTPSVTPRVSPTGQP